eukprot:GGOE01021217.1.p1 GENE.GGOE01021217.1~~GGOE01021217.1.p1  ORF type:complete len:385 (-),score=47.09 GGOE01021217.1:864-2018(-)
MAPKRKECAKKVANPTTRKSKPNGESLGKKAKQPNCDGSLLAESQTVVNCAAPATGADCIVELLAQARRHQLDAVDEETLAAVEKDLKQVVERTETSRMPALSSERELALQRLALLLCQQGRSEEATTYLKRLGCSYRLSREVLCSTPSDVVNIPTAEEAAPFVGAVDDALPPDMLAVMRHAFAPDSAFWHEHCYNCETSDYFSYLHCLTGDPAKHLPIGRLGGSTGQHSLGGSSSISSSCDLPQQRHCLLCNSHTFWSPWQSREMDGQVLGRPVPWTRFCGTCTSSPVNASPRPRKRSMWSGGPTAALTHVGISCISTRPMRGGAAFAIQLSALPCTFPKVTLVGRHWLHASAWLTNTLLGMAGWFSHISTATACSMEKSCTA